MNISDCDALLSGIDDTLFELTHPVIKNFNHKTWNAFANDLTNACGSIFPLNPVQYRKVHALLLNWEVDDLGTEVELQDLGSQLRSQFNFTIEFWKIPSQEGENELEKKLSQVKGELEGQENLLIVYYGGHGKWDSKNRSIWAANRQKNSPTLNWSELQPMLKRASCDVFIVLDCCFAGSAGRDNVNGTKELLAACGMEVIAEDVSKYSFTRNLIDKLRSFGTRPFTVSELYERLIRAKRRLRNTPQYVPLTGRDKPSIRIARLEPTAPIIMTHESALSPPQDSLPPSDSALSSSSSSSLNSSQSSSDPARRVLLAVSLESDSQVPQLESWKRWLLNDAPINIRSIEVRIEDAYQSNSTLMFVSMPVALWCHLPDTNAYRFVDFITSGSIFKESPHTLGQQDIVRQPTVGQLQTLPEEKDEKIVQSEALSGRKEDASAQKDARIEHQRAELRALSETTRTRETEPKDGQLETFETLNCHEEQQVSARIESREQDVKRLTDEQNIGVADPISTASGLPVLVQFALQSQILLHQAVENLHSKKKIVRELREELEALNTVLRSLQYEIVANTDTDFSSLNLALLRCGKDCNGFKAVIVKWTANDDRYGTSFQDWAKLTYLGIDVIRFKDKLRGYKSTFFIAFTDVNMRIPAVTTTSFVLKEFKEMVMNTTIDLEDHLQDTNNQLRNISPQLFSMPNKHAAELENLQEEIASIKQCLVICSHAVRTADQYHTNTFQGIYTSNDSPQIIVSTVGDLISARRVTGGSRSTQVLGLMSDDSIQHLVQDLNYAVTKKETGPEIRGSQFEDLYGTGVKLNLQSLKDVDATSK